MCELRAAADDQTLWNNEAIKGRLEYMSQVSQQSH